MSENTQSKNKQTDQRLKLVTKTLDQLGPNLPVGIPVSGGGRARQFRLRPFRFIEEKAIAKLKEDMRGATFGEFVTGVMGIMIQTVGPHSFDNKKDGEKSLVLCQLTLADVLYMYVWLRYEAMGPDEPLDMNCACPNCGKTLKLDALLATVEVRTIPDEATDMTSTVTLRDGLDIRGKIIQQYKIAPLKWDVTANSEFAATNSAARDSLVIRNSIVKAVGDPSEPFVLGEDQLDLMSKFDLATITKAIESAAPGPKMSIEVQCDKPGCKAKFARVIDWTFDRFFSRGAPEGAR